MHRTTNSTRGSSQKARFSASAIVSRNEFPLDLASRRHLILVKGLEDERRFSLSSLLEKERERKEHRQKKKFSRGYTLT